MTLSKGIIFIFCLAVAAFGAGIGFAELSTRSMVAGVSTTRNSDQMSADKPQADSSDESKKESQETGALEKEEKGDKSISQPGESLDEDAEGSFDPELDDNTPEEDSDDIIEDPEME